MTHPHDQTYPGHALDESGGIAYDPRCFWCREITAQPPPGTTGPLPAWLEDKLDRLAAQKDHQ